VQDGPYCVAECPASKYANATGICLPCHPNCTESAGCTGPLDTVGPGACNSCALVHFDEVEGEVTMRCLQPDTQCADGFYRGVVPEPLRGPGIGKLASLILAMLKCGKTMITLLMESCYLCLTMILFFLLSEYPAEPVITPEKYTVV